jgi:colicin import membrane protein
MLGQAGATGGPNATGSAQRDAGPSASYAGRIVARVKPNIVLTDSVPSTLLAVVEVRAAPDGTIVGRRLVKSSGNSTWDNAVLRAIDRTEILPRDTDGRVPSPIEIEFRPS